MATNNTKHTHTLRCGNITVTIWQMSSGGEGTVLRNDLLSAVQRKSGWLLMP